MKIHPVLQAIHFGSGPPALGGLTKGVLILDEVEARGTARKIASTIPERGSGFNWKRNCLLFQDIPAA